MTPQDLAELKRLAALADVLDVIDQRRGFNTRNKFFEYFPDDGPYRRELYPKHMKFFELGATYIERMFMAANRVGKTEGGAYELTCHLTGLYPHWWVGKRFAQPVDCWVAGDTSLTVRDILQKALLGEWGKLGSGMVPAHLIYGEPTRRQGIPEAYESFWVRHVSGGLSKCAFKSYDQRRQAFQGTEKHVCWLDEEPDDDGGIYAECLTRCMTVDGIVYLTATPLRGLTVFIKEYLEKAVLLASDGSLVEADKHAWSTGTPTDIQ